VTIAPKLKAFTLTQRLFILISLPLPRHVRWPNSPGAVAKQTAKLNLLVRFQERRVAERLNRHLKQQLANYKVPDVMDYVEEKASLYELQKKVKCWERKVDIASVSC